MGRPPEIRDRVRLAVFLERTEYRLLQRTARAAEVSLSAWARRALLAAQKETTS